MIIIIESEKSQGGAIASICLSCGRPCIYRTYLNTKHCSDIFDKRLRGRITETCTTQKIPFQNSFEHTEYMGLRVVILLLKTTIFYINEIVLEICIWFRMKSGLNIFIVLRKTYHSK
jgi:hypothetical protein